jgi:hypothetical protein
VTKLSTEVTKYIRRNFTEAERLHMGSELASCHSRINSIDNEEAVVKHQFKARKAEVEGTISTLVLNLEQGFTMENVKCRLVYGQPNPLEVSIVRLDTGAVIETRAMTGDERQQELPLDVPTNEAAAEASAEQSAANVAEFFNPQDNTATDQPEPIEPDPAPEVIDAEWPDIEPITEAAPPLLFTDPQTSLEAINPEHDAEFEALATEPSPDEMFAAAVRLTVEAQKCSTSILQRELAIGYARAAQLLNLMKQAGVVGPGEGNGKRAVLKDKAWLEEVMSGDVDRHPADEILAPKDSAPAKSIADEHRDRVAKTFKPKALRESGFKGEEPKIPEVW